MRRGTSAVWLQGLVAAVLIASPVGAQDAADPSAIVLERDRQFWQAYNECRVKDMQAFFTDDVEFYHDKGGATLGVAELLRSVQDNLCSNPESRVKRQAVDGSVRLFPLRDGDRVYGAVLSGQHLFYAVPRNGPQRLAGRAAFVHLWLMKDGRWKMARILSYDHQPAAETAAHTPAAVPEAVLDRLAGSYRGPSGVATVRSAAGQLRLKVGPNEYVLSPASETSFFTEGRDLTFEFRKDSGGEASSLVVREHGKTVEELQRLDQ